MLAVFDRPSQPRREDDAVPVGTVVYLHSSQGELAAEVGTTR
jgi:hypothetical protein